MILKKKRTVSQTVLVLFLAGLYTFYKGFEVFYGFVYVDEIPNQTNYLGRDDYHNFAEERSSESEFCRGVISQTNL